MCKPCVLAAQWQARKYMDYEVPNLGEVLGERGLFSLVNRIALRSNGELL